MGGGGQRNDNNWQRQSELDYEEGEIGLFSAECDKRILESC